MTYNESVDFEWDDAKDSGNYKKHGVRFSEAASVWHDHDAIEMFDPDHSIEEERWLRLGYSFRTRMLVVVYCEKIDSESIRVISARKATETEVRQYYKKGR